MSRIFATLIALAAAVLVSRGARADDKPAADDRPVRVRASHRVDVIAPGERVETIIDRMRTTNPPAATGSDARAGERLPVRPPDARMHGGDRPSDARGGPGSGRAPPQSGGGPPSERPRR